MRKATSAPIQPSNPEGENNAPAISASISISLSPESQGDSLSLGARSELFAPGEESTDYEVGQSGPQFLHL